jgi:hypothetical protein
MKARALPLAAALLGLATLAVFLMLGSSETVRAAYPSAEVGLAVSEFQRAETLADIARVFGTPPDEARIAAMNAVNELDLWGFIPAYALFLCAVAVMLGGLGNRWTQMAIAFALTGALADAIETWKQLELTADIANAEAHLPIAPWHWLKYAALALNGVAIASLCITAARRRWILAVIALLPLPLVAAAYVDLLSPRLFAGAFTLYWLALLAVAVKETIWAKGSPAEARISAPDAPRQ